MTTGEDRNKTYLKTDSFELFESCQVVTTER